MAPSSPFKDHFSSHAADYARHRPTYPPALFAYLAGLPPQRALAWDVGTGNGQAALGLAAHFERVVATDASRGQLAHAVPHARVAYHVAPAEQAPLGDRTVDLVTAAVALHWFDHAAFYAEVRRVLRPGGVLAAWAYDLVRVTPAVDAVLDRYEAAVVGPYWPPERRHVAAGYKTLSFPFDELAPPSFVLEHRWTLDDVVDYLRTWSSTQRYLAARGEDPLLAVRGELAAAWGDPALRRPARWPLHLRVGRTR